MQISINRALGQLKVLDARIAKTTNRPWLGIVAGGLVLPNYPSNEAFEKEAKASYESVLQLIANRRAIKGAIVQSNAETMVKIGGDEFTVAAAIERKSSIQYDKNLLDVLKAQFASHNAQIDQRNLQVEGRLDSHLETLFGQKTERNATTEEVETVTEAFYKRYLAKLIDPIDIASVIDKMEDSITVFEQEVDVVLTESNTRTMIDIPEYQD